MPQEIAQDSYSKFLKRGFDGCIADNGLNDVQRGYSMQDVPFGKMVMDAGTGNPNQLVLPSPATPMSVQRGVAIFRQAIDDTVIFTPPSELQYPKGTGIYFKTVGRMFIVPEDSPKFGDPVFVRVTQLASGGQDQLDLLRFAATADGGGLKIGVIEGGVTFAGGVLPAGFSASDLQAAINATPAGPVSPDVLVFGDQLNGFQIDWGPDSQNQPYTLAILTNALTRNGVLVSLSLTNLIEGYPPATRLGVGSFRTTSDGGSCVDANTLGAFRTWSWWQGVDVNGVAVLKIG